VGVETNTAMSPEFLMEQMEWREAVEEAEQAADGSALEHLHHRLRGHARELVDTLARQLDDEENVAAAAESVRRLMFLDKLRHEIDDAPEALDNGHMALLQLAHPGQAAPHEAFDRSDGVGRIGRGMRQRLGADIHPAVRTVVHNRRQENSALRARQAFGAAAAHGGDKRVGSAEVDARGKAVPMRLGRLARFGDLQ